MINLEEKEGKCYPDGDSASLLSFGSEDLAAFLSSEFDMCKKNGMQPS